MEQVPLISLTLYEYMTPWALLALAYLEIGRRNFQLWFLVLPAATMEPAAVAVKQNAAHVRLMMFAVMLVWPVFIIAAKISAFAHRRLLASGRASPFTLS